MGNELKRIKNEINNTIRDIYTARGTLIRILIPFTIAFSVLGLLYLTFGKDVGNKLLYIYGIYSLPFLDIPVAFGLGLAMGISYYLISFWLFVAESCTSLFVSWNFDHLHRFKWFQKKIIDARKKVDEWTWLKRLRIFAVTFITILPFAGAGSIVAPIVGRFLGLSVMASITGVMLGSILRFTFFMLLTKGIIAITLI